MKSVALTPNAWLRFDLIRQLLSQVPDASSLLEIGCGGGAFAARVSSRYEYVGYEPDRQSYELAHQRVVPPATLVCGFLPPHPDRHFDLVAAFEVLEHIADDSAALKDWYNWVRPEGHLLLSVPAHPKRFSAADAKVGHYRRYTRERLIRQLTAAGFDRIIVWSYGFPLGYALEFARNVLASGSTGPSKVSGTAASGRWLHPPRLLSGVTRAGTWPFRQLQRTVRSSDLGTGYVTMARRPR
jgi:SAM-dependent methyltransferase